MAVRSKMGRGAMLLAAVAVGGPVRIASAAVVAAPRSQASAPAQVRSTPTDGAPNNGAPNDGAPNNGAPNDGAPTDPAIVRPMAALRIAATIKIGKTADWVAITPGGVWVGSTGPDAVSVIDPATDRVTAIPLPGRPCSGIAADARYVWVPLCGPVPRLARVSIGTRALDRVFDIGPVGGEQGIAIGAGSVWLVTDRAGSLARIDPADGSVVAIIRLPAGSYNPVFADGRVWVTRVDGTELTVVDPAAGRVSGQVAVGQHPRFVAAGGGAVWTLNQGTGDASRIDTAGDHAVTTVPLHTPGPGGDIAFADGRVWTTMMGTPLSAIDAGRGVLLCQWKGAGGDSLGIGHGSIWLTNLKAGTVSRIALDDLPRGCAATR